MHEFADAVPSDLRALFGRLADRYRDTAAPEPAGELAAIMSIDTARDGGHSPLHGAPVRRGQRAKRAATAIAATTLGKVVFGASLAAAAVGAGQATGIIHIAPHTSRAPSAPTPHVTNEPTASSPNDADKRAVEPKDGAGPTASVDDAPGGHDNPSSVDEPAGDGSANDVNDANDATVDPGDDNTDGTTDSGDATTVVTSGDETDSPPETASDDAANETTPRADSTE